MPHWNMITLDSATIACRCWSSMIPILMPLSLTLTAFSSIFMLPVVTAATISPLSEYPTLKIFKHGIPTEYYGAQKADAFVGSLSKSVAPDVAILGSDSAISDFVHAAGLYFPIFVGFGLNESVILDLAVRYKQKAWFSVAKDFSNEILTMYHLDKVPALAAIHPAYSEHNIFYGPFEEEFLEDYIRQSFLPLALPINQDSLKALGEDTRKVILTILEDETAEKSQDLLLEVLKAAAAANRDLLFGYVGQKQWKDFTDSFEDENKTQLPKMVVWDGGEKYYSVIGYESMHGSEGSGEKHVSRFLEGYREGRVVEKHVIRRRMGAIPWTGSGSEGELGIIIMCILVLVALVIVQIRFLSMSMMTKVEAEEEPLSLMGMGITATT